MTSNSSPNATKLNAAAFFGTFIGTLVSLGQEFDDISYLERRKYVSAQAKQRLNTELMIPESNPFFFLKIALHTLAELAKEHIAGKFLKVHKFVPRSHLYIKLCNKIFTFSYEKQ